MKQEILIPSYYNEFKCIGSACEDTCCAGWKVTVDKESFNKYRKITSGPLAEDLKKNISRERKNPSDMTYGKIKLDSSGKCNLLNDKGLCTIQIELGEEYLCHTCTIYPRYINTVDNRLEKSLTVSCPEAARLILLNPKGIDFIIEEETVKALTSNPTQKYFWDIRMYTIELLQTRSATIEDRLIVLGMFIEKVEQLQKNNDFDELESLMNRYRQLLQSKDGLASIHALPNNIFFQLQSIRQLLNNRLAKGINSKRYKQCLDNLVDGLKLSGSGLIENSMSAYNDSYNNFYQPFFKDYDYILENYLVNYMFKNTFPHNLENIFKQFAQFILHFIIIKVHLIGIANTNNGLSEDLCVTCIQSFSKEFEHTNQFFIDAMQQLENEQQLTMAHIAILIKS